MSLRSKTQKAKKFGTPSAPSPTAQKSSPTSPRATGGTPSAPSPSAAPKASSPRTYGITQTEQAQAVQQQFKTRVQKLTAPLRDKAHAMSLALQGSEFRHQSKQAIQGFENEMAEINEEIARIEEEEHNIELQNNVNQIINALESGNILFPDYFQNNIAWVKTGAITQQAFLDSYYYLSNQGIIHSAPTEPTEPIIELPELLPEAEAQLEPIPIITPTVDDSINTNMVTQQLINFNIINGRAVGSIRFVATDNFNPFYYGKNIVNLVQFKTPNDVTLLVKENRLNFTETERDEVISYDESVSENTRITIESYVWSSAIQPTPFSNMFSVKISATEPPKPISSGFMGAGVAGAIAGLVLLGFIVDSKVGK